ncbi:hypothetical protein OPV22_015736 [Ensete ventricosum]|uniref:Uncharacterized protein n=1 Tax=Ensete ventricosum TaxID=4639 RepID=A0AAV8RAJ8_ENSVE|nr:hypothetical protein OPV22_015736 [Ensete ventricosum]
MCILFILVVSNMKSWPGLMLNMLKKRTNLNFASDLSELQKEYSNASKRSSKPRVRLQADLICCKGYLMISGFMRSNKSGHHSPHKKSAGSLLLIDIKAVPLILAGGQKQFRASVLQELDDWKDRISPCVLGVAVESSSARTGGADISLC